MINHRSKVAGHLLFVTEHVRTDGDNESISLYHVEDVMQFQAEIWMLNSILSALMSKTHDL